MTGPPLSYLDGLHRRRAGRHDRRPRVPRSCSSGSRGGRHSCSPAHGWQRTGCCARARSGTTATPTKCARAARRRLRLSAGGRSAGEQGAAAVRPRRLDDRSIRRPAHAASRASVRATRLRERPLAWSLLLVTAANVVVLWALASAAAAGRISLGELVVYGQCVVGTSLIAFGGFNWALDGAAAPVAAVCVSSRRWRRPVTSRSGRRSAGVCRRGNPLP